MRRSWGKALWGYRKKETDLFMDGLDAQIAERQQERETALAELKENVQSQAQTVQAAEAALKALQAEYFQLSGELTALTMRSQQTLEEAEGELHRQEELAQQEVRERRQYVESLADTIGAVPDQIRSVIERIAAPMMRSPAAKSSSDSSLESPVVPPTPVPPTNPGERSSG
jgi:peptidoglycan hydrolase CwlO-like protein